MIAVDTNVVVRLLTGDDREQAASAQSLFDRETIWIAKTVLLETEWVLRSLFHFDATTIRNAFAGLLGLPNVRAEDETSVAAALALSAHGIDFADALHLSSKPAGSVFSSFDKSIINGAKRAGVQDIRLISEAE